MPGNRERLIKCFGAVFPELGESEIVRATTYRTSAWDSVATTTLAALVEEEFEVQVDPQSIEKLNSFDAFLKLVG